MRILCLTSRLPYPPDRGDRHRVLHFLRHLSGEHEITLVSFIARDAERQYIPSLQQYCRDVQLVRLEPTRSALSVLANVWRPDPLQVLYYRSESMRRQVDQLLLRDHFDVAYAHLFRMAPYVAGRTDLYRVVDLTDVISKEVSLSLPYRRLPWRLAFGLERQRVERYECQVAARFDEAWLISEADRQTLSARCPGANLHVVTIGVDDSHFFPTGARYDPLRLIFVGHMRVFHNVDAATHLVRDVLPLVRQQIPDCTLHIVGADPHPHVRRLASVAGVSVTGYVPDLNACLNGASVFVAPLRFAAGVQTKVIEAMATARPVVTTSLVAAGLGARPGQDLLVADEAPALAGHIVALLRDEQLRIRLGQAGRQFMQRNFGWGQVLTRMKAIERTVKQEKAACASS